MLRIYKAVVHHPNDFYIHFMITENKIRRVAARMAKAADAERVILYGSYARGNATETSDVDLLVVAESSLPRFKRSRKLYSLFKPYPFPMDIVVYTPQEFEKSKESKLSFVSTVLREGRTVYERGNRAQQAMDCKSEQYSVEIRYPDDWFMPSAEDAQEARDAAEQVRTWLQEVVPELFTSP